MTFFHSSEINIDITYLYYIPQHQDFLCICLPVTILSPFYLPPPSLQDFLRICLLPTILSYDAEWPVRKVPLRCSAHYIVHHMETKTYCVLTSIAQPTPTIWKFNGDDKVG